MWPDRQDICNLAVDRRFSADGPPAGAKNETRALVGAYYGSLGRAQYESTFHAPDFGFICGAPIQRSQLVAMAALSSRTRMGAADFCQGGSATAVADSLVHRP